MSTNVYEQQDIENNKLPDAWQTDAWQSPSVLDELEDFLQQNWQLRSIFYDDKQIDTKQQFLKFTAKNGIRTNNYIGTIVFKGGQLNIYPKIFRTTKGDNSTDRLDIKHLTYNISQWIQYFTKKNYPIHITNALNDSKDLRELFITLYVHYVKGVLDKGIYHCYENCTEDISVIRGKIDFKDYFLKKYPNGHRDKFLCTYSTFEMDNMLNRIIKCTCKSLYMESSKANQRIIGDILIKLSSVSDVQCSPYDCDKIRLSYLHRQYALILSMSKILLLNKTILHTTDNTESFCFLFPTELLFESFIGGFIQNNSTNLAKVYLQASKKNLFSNVRYREASLSSILELKPDIIVDSQEKGMFILDTKYKMIEKFSKNNIQDIIKKKISISDIYQVLAYARTYGVGKVFLLYPMFRDEDIDLNFPVCINLTPDGDKDIHVYIVRIPFVFESESDNTIEKLDEIIKHILNIA